MGGSLARLLITILHFVPFLAWAADFFLFLSGDILLIKINIYVLAFSIIAVFGGEDDSKYKLTAYLDQQHF